MRAAEDSVIEKMQDHRAAHMWRLLEAAHALARDHGGALSDADRPEEWKLLKQEAAAEADPLADIVAQVVRENVVPCVVVKEGAQLPDGQPATRTTVDFIQRTALSRLVPFAVREAGMRPQSAANIQNRLDARMAAQGFKFVADTTRHGVPVKQSYMGCKLRDGVSEL